jgi:hypothetical protein
MDNHDLDLDKDGIVSPEELEVAKERWETKRKIVWICLAGIFIFGALIAGLGFTGIAEAKLKIVSEVITTIIFGFMTIIASYFGFSTWMQRK